MSAIAAIGEQDIERHVGARSFSLGEQYAQSGAIFDARRQGMTLKARCEGSSGGPYRVQVTLGPAGISAASCTCPVGSSGTCKHVAALLLTWLERPEEFIEISDPNETLEQRSKADLIALIKQMLRQAPELEPLLDTPLPGSGRRRTAANPEVYRRQAAAVFREIAPAWGAEVELAPRLLAIVAIGDGFAEQQDFAGAAAVYEAVSSAVIEHFEAYSDEGWELASVITACIAGLGRSLAGAQDPATREAIMRALFAIYQLDITWGGIGLADEVPGYLLKHTAPDERRTIAGWIREALPQGDGWSDTYRRQAYGAFLLDLEADTLDDEAFLRITRETGRIHDLVERLLTLGRVDEAIAEVERASDHQLLDLADLLVEHGRGEAAERIMRERSATTQDLRTLEWLKNYYLAHNNPEAALESALKLFHASPDLAQYRELRDLARGLGRWDGLRPELLTYLNTARHYGLLVQVYLDEGDIERALQTLRAGPVYEGLQLEVAQAAEETRPEAALEIYKQYAERLIERQGRSNYQEASRWLARMRALYRRLDEEETWNRYIAELRERYRRLRALQEELAAAGL